MIKMYWLNFPSSTGCLKKNGILWKNGHNYLQTHPKCKIWGCFGKFRIFATLWALRFSKMKPEVANPPSKNRQNSLLTLCTPLMILCIFMTCNVKIVFHTLVEGKVKVVLYPWPDVSS